MENKVNLLLKENFITKKDTIVCAVSGGVDSVSMLLIMHKLGYKVILAHVNHHKREQSNIEEQAMQSLAFKLNVPFELLSYNYEGNDNFHNDSHHARYNFFKDVCNKYNTNIIATAHHLDDQIETILIKIIEGSNLYGYGGISTCYDDGEYRVIRPLINFTKKELYKYAKDNQVVFFEDQSNAENEFLRNRLRHNIIPLLHNECKDLYHKVSQYSLQLKEAFAYIRKQSIDYLKNTNNKIELKSFNSLDIALQKDIISLLLEKYNIRRSNNLINDINKLLKDNSGEKSITLEGGYIFIRSYDLAYIHIDINSELIPIKLNIKDTVIYNNKYKLYFSNSKPNNNAKYINLCYNTIELPLTIRPKQEGDNIKLLIGTKKVNRVFIDHKISKNERNQIPIITDNNGNILWIYDLVKSKEVYDQKNNGDIYLVCEVIA